MHFTVESADYHGTQPAEIIESEIEAHDVDYIAIPDKLTHISAETITQLSQCIENSKEIRRPLFDYFLHITQQLKQFIDTPVSTDTTDSLAPALQHTLVQFFITLQQLLKTSQSTSTSIHYNNKNVQIHGLQRNVWAFYQPSTSGQMIKNTLFPTVMLLIDTSPTEITKTINTLFKDHLCDAILKDNQRLESEADLLKEQLIVITGALWQARSTFESTHGGDFFKPTQSLLSNNTTIETTRASTMSTDDEKLQAMIEKNKRIRFNISRLKQKIIDQTAETNEIQAHIEQQKERAALPALQEQNDITALAPLSRPVPEQEVSQKAAGSQLFGEYTIENMLSSAWTLLKSSVAPTANPSDDVYSDDPLNLFEYY